ncbi:MAG: LL-diaminopimelate aminotransferase, partial [Clostridia bacterium]|nr:LL-diaminopimelate aminotransferase [Clostridia bacterium]
DAMHEAVNEMGEAATFRGYGPYEGYEFLRTAISESYLRYGIDIQPDEIYVSDGAKSDTANILEIFQAGGNVLIPNPTYPVYVDSSIIAGRNICYIDANESNNFLPLPDYSVKPSIIYLCSPNNPTGAVYNKKQLKKWVDYALENQAIILFDAAYEAFIEDPDLPHSIFEIEGSKECVIEICSFSKGAGFTGVRCGYVAIPNELKVDGKSVGEMWLRRQSIKFNGTSYITQKGAAAALSKEGMEQTRKNINYYKENAKMLSETLKGLNIWHIGGKNSPYIWLKCPNNMDSWEFFDILLTKSNIVGTPGSGFGTNGEGFFRLSSFGKKEDVEKATQRIKKLQF